MHYLYQTAASFQALMQQFTKVVSGVFVVTVWFSSVCVSSSAEGVFYWAQKALEINRKSKFKQILHPLRVWFSALYCEQLDVCCFTSLWLANGDVPLRKSHASRWNFGSDFLVWFWLLILAAPRRFRKGDVEMILRQTLSPESLIGYIKW